MGTSAMTVPVFEGLTRPAVGRTVATGGSYAPRPQSKPPAPRGPHEGRGGIWTQDASEAVVFLLGEKTVTVDVQAIEGLDEPGALRPRDLLVAEVAVVVAIQLLEQAGILGRAVLPRGYPARVCRPGRRGHQAGCEDDDEGFHDQHG